MSRTPQAMMCFQLALPLPESPRRVALPPAEQRIAPAQLWATLTPALQASLHQALLRALEEALYDAPRH
jgi:hypothetical protein